LQNLLVFTFGFDLMTQKQVMENTIYCTLFQIIAYEPPRLI